jgi:hypothetical protein
MDKPQNILTVGQLRRFLENVVPDSEITFGASKFRKRPLIFYRFKSRGENLLQIELNEIDQNWEPTSEIDCRPVVRDFLRQLEEWKDDDEITFGSSLDAVPLEFRSLSNVVAINLEQNQEPEWKVQGD